MMKDSLIVGFFVTLFNKIVEVYDGSVFEKIIKSVCGFFIKRSENSSICSFFKKEQKQDSYLSNSIFYRIVTFPIKLIKLISQKCSGGITKAYNNSQIIKIFNNVTKISIRQFGFIMAGYFASMLLFYVIFNSNVQKAVIIIAGVLLILSGIMCLFDFGISSVISSSVLINPFLNMFNRYSVDKTAVTCYRIDKLMVFIIVAVILGAISGAVSPIISFLAIAGAVFVVFVLNNAFFGACFTVFAAPVFPTMVCVGLSLLTICAYILELIRIKDKKFIFTGTDFFVVCFICLQIFSAITSFNPQKSIPVCIVSCTFILMYFVIINTAYDKDRWYKLLLCFIGAGVVISLIGIYQNFFGGSTSTSWVDEDMFEDIKTRVYATLDNPNVLGQYLVLVIPVTFAAMWSAKKTFEKIIFAVCVALMGACLLFTWSRAAWVGAVLAIAFYFVMKDRRWVTVGIIVLLLLPFILPESIMSRITSIGNTGDSSTAYRVSDGLRHLRWLVIIFWAVSDSERTHLKEFIRIMH